MKKVAIIGTVGVPACYGGFETLVENLIEVEGFAFNVYSSSKHYPESEHISTYKNAKITYIPLHANGISSVFYDFFSMLHAIIFRSDVLLILGVSGCLFLPLIRWFSSCKIITNIDGLEWRRNKWNRGAKKFLKISERFAVKFSDVIISDNDAIADYVYDEYQVKSVVIAYGGDHAFSNKTSEVDSGYALALCRIEPENNIDMILDAFRLSNMPLKFIGNWNNSDYGRSLKEIYSRFSNIEIIDPIYDVNELEKLRSACSFYVHGHSAGGTNPSLVEMMHFTKRILCYDCSYNRATTENRAEFFSDVNELISLINSPVLNRNIPHELKSIADRRYTWRIIKKLYMQLF